MATFVKVGSTKDMAPGQGKLVEAGGKKIALFNVEGAYYAIDNTCSHRGGSLAEGELEGTNVTCPWHRAVFDVKTGEALGPPAPKGVARYNVRVSGESIEVEV
jgi:nitrite reductase (NADH) small subunit